MYFSIFGSDGTDPEEDSGVLEPQDTLENLNGISDVLDTGWSPAERPWAVEDWGTTPWEEVTGESLAGRLARELPQPVSFDGDGLGDVSDTDGELIDDEVGGRRAGRLVDTGEGGWRGAEPERFALGLSIGAAGAGDAGWGDDEPELYALDVGIDVGAASAEEAAMHVVLEPDDDWSPRWTER